MALIKVHFNSMIGELLSKIINTEEGANFVQSENLSLKHENQALMAEVINMNVCSG